MAFTLEIWRNRVQERMPGWQMRLQQAGAGSIYAFLSAATIWPIVEAMRQGEWAAMSALGGVVAALGTNLLAATIQEWKNEADGAQKLEAYIVVDAGLRAEIDAVLEELNTLVEAQTVLKADEQSWFTQTLQPELLKLGNLPRFQTILYGGDYAEGDIHKRDRGIHVDGQAVFNAPAVGGDVRTLIMGDQINYGTGEDYDPTRRYLNGLINKCNQLTSLVALSHDLKDTTQMTLQDVYIDLDTTEQIKPKAKLYDEEGGRPDLEKERPLRVLEAAAKEQQVVILGDPGSGKSSFVRYLTLRLAAAAMVPEQFPAPDGWERPKGEEIIPLLTILRDLGPKLGKLDLDGHSFEDGNQKLREAIWSQWQEDLKELGADMFVDLLPELLRSGRVLLIFDGLDEVQTTVRERLNQAILAVKAMYSKSLIQPSAKRVGPRIIVTSRIRSYPLDNPEKILLPNFKVFTLAPFTKEQIDNFVAGWYNAARLPAVLQAERTRNLQQAVSTPDMLRLARNPMLLTTMALIHQTNTELPRERVLLYDQAVEILILRWQKHRGLQISKNLQAVLEDSRRLRKILNRLGYESHLLLEPGADSADLTRRDVIAILEDEIYADDPGLPVEFLNYVDHRAGLLVGRGGSGAANLPQLYSFPHRTFLQFLAGCYMVSLPQKEMLKLFHERLDAGNDWYVAGQMGVEYLLYRLLNDDKFLGLAFRLCPPEPPVSEADWRGVVWSGHMATLLDKREIAEDPLGAAYWERLRPRLQKGMEDAPLGAQERAEAGRHLARLGDTRAGVLDAAQMEMCYVPGGPFVMGEGDERHVNEELNRGYWIGRFPVTQAHFGQFVAAGGYQNPDYWPEAIRNDVWRKPGEVKAWWDDSWRSGPYPYGDPLDLANHPVVGIMWYEMVAFTRWLNGVVDLPGRYEIQLPSETEWEKAARGGIKVYPNLDHVYILPLNRIGRGTDPEIAQILVDNPGKERQYPWGAAEAMELPTPDLANYRDTQIGSTCAVGGFPDGASPYGCEELAGNVWEWTRSQYKGYPYVAQDGREDHGKVTNESTMVLRGGAYYSSIGDVRCASRYRNDPDGRLSYGGFRVVLSPFISDR